MKIGELLNKLATKSGIESTDKALMDLLSKAEFANQEVPDAIANKIDSSLMDITAAQAHPDVVKALHKKIKGETLNGADKIVEKLIAELGFDLADVADITADANTYSKIEKLVKKTNELAAKKAGTGNNTDKVAFQKQIDDLNGQILTVKNAHKLELDKVTGDYSDKLTNFELINMFSGKKLSLPDDMPAKVKNDIVLNAVKAELSAKGFQIVNTNGNYEVKRIDGTDAYDEGNRKVALTGLIDGVLAQNKLLAVTDPNPPAPPIPPIPGGPNVQVNQSAMSLIDAALADSGAMAKTP